MSPDWIYFAGAYLVCMVLLFLPGALVVKACNISWLEAVACSPVVSFFLFGLCGIVLELLGVRGSVTLIVTVLFVGFVAVLCSRVLVKRATAVSEARDSLSWAILGLYLVVGTLAMTVFFLKSLDGPSSFLQFSDNVAHLNMINGAAHNQSFSTLATYSYPRDLPTNEIPFSGASYYPFAWHIPAALLVSVLGISVPMAENVLNFVLASAVFPAGVFAFLSVVFRNDRGVVLSGAFVTMLFAAFPLRMLVVHQAYPNFAAFACVPAVMSLAVNAYPRQGERLDVCAALAAFSAFLGIALLHPNAAIAVSLSLAAYVAMVVVPRACEGCARLRDRRSAVALIEAGVFAGAVALWFLLLNSSFMSSVVNFLWEWTIDAPDALRRIANLGLCLGIPQGMLAAVTLIGLVYVVKAAAYRWVALAYVLNAVVFFFNACGTPDLKRLFAGFWYTDPERTAAMVAVAAMPLAAAGLCCVARGAIKVVGGVGRKWSRKRPLRYLEPCAIVLLGIGLSAYNSYVTYTNPYNDGVTALEQTAYELEFASKPENIQAYSSKEMEFVSKVKQVVPEGALLLNMPYDGSAFAYMKDDLNVYYKTYGGVDETPASQMIRLKLNEIASNVDVSEAVHSTGAEYLLVLDRSEFASDDRGGAQSPFAWYFMKDWRGFDGITDETPGFEVVLAEGSLRLYKIVA